MSLSICIPDLIANGKLTGARAERASTLYDELLAQYEGKYGRGAAESMATTKAIEAIEREFSVKRRQVALQAKAQATIHKQSRALFDGGKGADGPIDGRALLAHLVRDEKGGGISNLEYRWKAIKQRALAQLYDGLARHRVNLLGEVRHKDDLTDMVRVLAGEKVDNLNASEFAASWTKVAEGMRQRFNAAGGDIAKLEGWGLPHSHDPQRVGAMTAEQWIDATMPRLDGAKMTDRATGLPLSGEKMRLMLRDVYESIVSDGWNKRNPGNAGGRAVGNRHAEHRVLHFKSADDWIGYHDEFGNGSVFDAMMGHIETMARDTASMEILGPNPGATIRWMGDLVEKDAATKGSLADRAKATVRRYEIEKVWDEVQGQNRRVVRRGLALFGSTLRNWQSSTKLGSATLASMSDHATRLLTRQYNGLPATQLVGQYAKMLNPFDGGDRAFARRSGIIGDEFTGRMASQGRMHMEDAFGGRLQQGGGTTKLEGANEVSRRLADTVMRTSGLNAHTLAGREAMGMEFMAAFASFKDRDFDQIDAPFRNFLQRSGVDRAGWDAVRASKTFDYKGIDWIRPEDIADQSLADRIFEGMLTEIDFAVPTGGLFTRAMVHALPPGTMMGELIRVGFQFKMFPVTVVAMHGARMMAQSNLTNRAAYGAAFLGATTVAGALAYQLGEIAKGKDPRPMTDGDFWWRAMLKGGGMGVFGDAIEFSRNEFGQDVGDIVKGPSLGSVQTLATLGRSAVDSGIALYQDDPDLIEKAARLRGRAVRDLLVREVPGSSLWYLRAAYERLLVDTVAGWASDGAIDDSFRRMEQRAGQQGQEFWFRPGEGLDGARAPDLGNALASGDDDGGGVPAGW